MGFRCCMCRELFDWSMLVVLHELPHCSKCNSNVLTILKKQKELGYSPEPEIEKEEDWKPIKVSKSRGKQK